MEITTKGSRLVIGAMKYDGKDVAEKKFDLESRKGETIRVHIDIDNEYTIDIKPRQKVLVCELDVPKQSFESKDTGKIDSEGKKIYKAVRRKVKLSGVQLKKYNIGA
jgi:hypothetical protein